MIHKSKLSKFKFYYLIAALIFSGITPSSGKENDESSIIRNAINKYVGLESPPEPLKSVKAFKFISTEGSFSVSKKIGTEVESKKADDFQTPETAMTFIRNKQDKESQKDSFMQSGTIVGNSGVENCLVLDGSNGISFLELLPSGCIHQLSIANVWDKKLGGFKATYHRRNMVVLGDKFMIGNSIYYGVAVPFE